MSPFRPPAAVALCLLLATPAAPVAGAPVGQVTIYRCVDAAGRTSLRDSPCRKGERQGVRTMLRPTDPPPRPLPTPRATVVREPAARPQVVIVTPPRPLYECVRPDGERYTSESAEGDPRWVPLWTLGYPVVVDHGAHGGVGGRLEYRDRRGSVRLEGGRHWRGPGTVPGGPVVYAPAGTWVRDACHPLPPAEVCARLRDRRDALDRRYHSALQGERDAITREQRGIDARLAAECGA